ncbi:MAG: hypothetical protein OXG82_08325 [Gammaproteobacteria bacterium]|nr:hypothetical protein [Gammaproteobacteria bacterium]
MKATWRECLLWPQVSVCVVLAVVAGAMLDNRGYIGLADVLRPLAVIGSTALLVTAALMAFAPAAGRLFPAALYALFLYSQLRDGLAYFDPVYRIALAWWSMLGIPLAVHLVLRRVDPLRGARYALVIGVLVAAATCLVTAPSLFHAPPPIIDEDFARAPAGPVADRKTPLPDIIYVVPDRYPSSETLEREFGVDNAAFYAALRRRGFVVEEDARANYPTTFQSLASTLNSGYLDGFSTTYGTGTGDRRPLYVALEDNAVVRRLLALGYEFHNYGNWWEPTRLNRWADVNYQGYLDEFVANWSEVERLLLERTPALDVASWFSDEHDKTECHRIRRKFERLAEVGNGPAPVFVFAHMIVPHQPIAMDASGECLDEPLVYRHGKTDWRDFKAAFAEYLAYFNGVILRVIDRQMERRGDGGRELLFAIQSDEGPWPASLRRRPGRFGEMTPRDLRMKMGIVNALRLPTGMDVSRGAIATPVNNWRTIFNGLSGTGMAMLPHRSFVYPSPSSIYRFCDVTALVSGGATKGEGISATRHRAGNGLREGGDDSAPDRRALAPPCPIASPAQARARASQPAGALARS